MQTGHHVPRDEGRHNGKRGMRDLNMRNAVKRLRGIFDQMDETSHPMSVPSRQISQTNRQAGYHALNRRRHSTPMMPGNAHIAMSGNKETCCNWQPFPGSPLLHHGENWKNPELPVHTGGANLNGVVVGVQPLHPGELCHIRGGVQHGIPVHAHHAGAALELVRPQAGKRLPAPPVGSVWLGPARKIPQATVEREPA